MAKEVKIVTFIDDREGREDGEKELTHLVNTGWKIKAAGGGSGAGLVWGFVILQRKTDTPYEAEDEEDEESEKGEEGKEDKKGKEAENIEKAE